MPSTTQAAAKPQPWKLLFASTLLCLAFVVLLVIWWAFAAFLAFFGHPLLPPPTSDWPTALAQLAIGTVGLVALIHAFRVRRWTRATGAGPFFPDVPHLPRRTPRSERTLAAKVVEPVRTPVPPPSEEVVEDVARDVRDALSALVLTDTRGGDLSVRVSDWHKDGTPERLEVIYPARALARVHEQLVSIRATVGRLYPAKADEWHLASDSPRKCLILTDRADPLAPVITRPPLEEDVDLMRGALIGAAEGGGEWRQPLMGGVHLLVAGATSAGKGSVLWSIIRALYHPLVEGKVRLWVIDPKYGLEFAKLRPIAYRYADRPEAAVDVLEALNAEMERKARRLVELGLEKLETPTVEMPLDLLIVDEIANLVSTEYVPKDTATKAADLLRPLLSMGRAPGITVVAAVQEPTKNTVPMRSLFPMKIALRMSEAAQTNLILGQGARAEGALADLIPKAHPGIGYALDDATGVFLRVRAGYVSRDEAHALVDTVAAKRLERAALVAPDPTPVRVHTPEPLALDEAPTAPAERAPAERAPAERAPVHAEPEPTRAGEPAQVSDLEPGDRAFFDADVHEGSEPSVFTVADVEPVDEDGRERVRVRYVYDGEHTSRSDTLDLDEPVTRAEPLVR